MRLKIVVISVLLSLTLQSRPAYSQSSQTASRPKLIVGIVVDQMRYDMAGILSRVIPPNR